MNETLTITGMQRQLRFDMKLLEQQAFVRLVNQLEIDIQILTGLRQPFNVGCVDHCDMDMRRVEDTVEAAIDMQMVRIAAITSRLISYGAEFDDG
jgi:hypothetical protein